MQQPKIIGFEDLPDSAFVRVKKVAALFDVSTLTIYRWSRNGTFPKQCNIGGGYAGWNVGEIRAHIKSSLEKSYA